MNIYFFLQKRKYEILLIALIQHLYIGVVINDVQFYEKVLWPINMVILGLASVGIFMEKGKFINSIKNLLAIIVITLPVILPYFGGCKEFMYLLYISYIIFFSFIFFEVFKFLIKPSYINIDIISAAACGLFLLIEIFVFYFHVSTFVDQSSFKGIDYSSAATKFMDLVYYCSITLTTIGYGDIVPNAHQTKLVASLIGVTGQFYSVVLVGILLSKFTSHTDS